ncbi:MAG TPA: MFS transporter [Spirochaetota bacterium]|nr:MFS transporter [Spirochaetota bacterium]HPJ34550.1 MFS transporter [Spirochaetota bacterium]
MYIYLLLLTAGTAAALQGWNTLFNNFAVDNAGLNGLQVGAIQSVREIPGFLSLLVIYALFLMKEHRLAVFSVFLCGAGVMVTGMFPSFTGIMVTTFITSLGFHYFETTNQSLSLQYFNHLETPVVLSKMRSLNAMVNILVGVMIWGLSSFMGIPWLFAVTGGIVVLISIYAARMKPHRSDLPLQHKKFIFKRKYLLFYVLNFLSGARRQIFTVFAVYLMVNRYGYSIKGVTVLFLINNVINYFLSPMIGRAINRFGERKLLTAEYLTISFVFLAYAFTDSPYVAAGLYVIDNIFFNFAIAIRTYFQKVGEPADIAPSMAVGFTINHIAAVVIPVFGGALWLVDYRIPFVGGAVLGMMSLLCVSRIKT